MVSCSFWWDALVRILCIHIVLYCSTSWDGVVHVFCIGCDDGVHSVRAGGCLLYCFFGDCW